MHFSRRARALGFTVAFSLLAATVTVPVSVTAVGPLPECRLDDVLTAPNDYESGPVTLVDHILSVGADYRPTDLRSVQDAGVAGSGLVREIAFADLRALATAASANGTPIGSWSAFRGYRQQVKLFKMYADAYGYREAVTFSARPGHSEHQLGLAIDFMTAGGGSPIAGDWAKSAAGAWMEDHAWEFGWVMSYPDGLMATTCYSYEPWHYRYVGREVAAEIRASGLTTREYLWAHYTMIDPETGLPIASATPSPTPTETPSSTPDPTVLPPTAGPTAGSPGAPGTGSGEVAVKPAVAAAGLVLLLSVAGLVASLGFLRRSRR
jgi:D-alanyl-D-alanine carboxypeptidase